VIALLATLAAWAMVTHAPSRFLLWHERKEKS